jgi:hypothetical protein
MRTPSFAAPLAALALALAAAALPGLHGCAAAGVKLRESFGIEKREQLVDRVKEARDSQNAAKEQFESALQEFLAVTGQAGKGGELESRYNKLKSEYERSETRAGAVHDRIASVEYVANKLFAEWETELGQYQNATLRAQSQRQLADTKARYNDLLRAMKGAESKMAPVLSALHDQVLFLKHNLNAQAIASLQGTAVEVQNDVTGLIRDMEAAIAEANRFIEQMAKD